MTCAKFRANSTGTAFQIILYPSATLLYLKRKLSGNVWILAHSLTDNLLYRSSFHGTKILLFCSINFIFGACG